MHGDGGKAAPVRKIIYASRSARPATRDVLRDILTVSRARNIESGVTGLLLYSGESFLQLIEGDDEAVTATFGRIQADARHCDIRVLADEAEPVRAYPEWDMAFAHLEEEQLVTDLDLDCSPGRPLASVAVVPDGRAAEEILARYRPQVGQVAG